ncbi:hypothetical protein [Kitasatospora sp. NPDC002965]
MVTDPRALVLAGVAATAVLLAAGAELLARTRSRPRTRGLRRRT